MDKIIYKILKKLKNNNYEAYVVGGYVRDKVLGISTNVFVQMLYLEML